jgi:hypothetical protein
MNFLVSREHNNKEMSKKLFIEAFYTQFGEFIGELSKMYPDDKDFTSFGTNLSIMKYMNPMYPINFIKTDVIDKFDDKIISRDESFFLNNKDIQQSADIDIIYKLKNYITDMSPQNKESVWSYIEIITKITKKILE